MEVFMRCIYAVVPDHDFLIGQHPEDANVFVACGFSGEGFKFSILIGELVADLLTNTKSWNLTDEMAKQWDPIRYLGKAAKEIEV
jgi:glycine/D-amino acid oxidase-like deaminating enzyme